MNAETPIHGSYAVIGAGGGIGAALARSLSTRGARLFLGGRTLESLETLASEVAGTAAVVDARDFDQMEAFLRRAAETHDGLQGVVNCAGSLLLKPAHLTTHQEFQETVDANLTTAFATVRAAARVMKKDGSVVLVSSAAAGIGLPNHEAIAAAKAGVAGLVQSAAATYAKRRIRFNAVAPGLVDTPMTKKITSNERALESSIRLHPLGRVGQPGDIASAAAWLLSEESSWVTGQILQVDGGLASLKA